MTDTPLTETVQAAMAKVALAHGVELAYGTDVFGCSCGASMATETEHADHLAAELMRMLQEDFGLTEEVWVRPLAVMFMPRRARRLTRLVSGLKANPRPTEEQR